MHLYITFVLFILGLVFASFINALVYRIDKKYKYPDIFIRNSHCEKCKKELKWYELIPILSFVIFNGKCKECGYRVPLYYPISELLLGLGFGSIYYFQLDWYYFITLLFLFVLSYYDRVYKGIPKNITHTFLIYGAFIGIFNILNLGIFNYTTILLSLVLCLTLYTVGRILKKPFGFGDILILLGLGFLLTLSQYILFIYLFFGISAIYSIAMILLKKLSLKSKIPLLPFMFASFIFTMLLMTLLDNFWIFNLI